jgi:DNA-directed RNA polymerase subunit N (RpoN/RPB10)
MTSQLSYVSCVTCGNQLGHLFEPYYECVYKLSEKPNNYHFKLTNKDDDGELLTPGEVDAGLFQIKDLDRNIWNDYLKAYYTWLQRPVSEEDNTLNLVKYNTMSAKGLVMQALLADYNITLDTIDDHLPLNFSKQECVKYCCRQAFLTDNSKAIY